MLDGYDENSEYKNDISGAIQSSVDFLEVKGMTVDSAWVEQVLVGQDISNAPQAGRWAAGIAIRTNVATKIQ